MASFHDLTTAQLKQAVQIREQIESLQTRLNALLGGNTPTKKDGRTTAKRILSAATKKKMAAAQQARWAKTKASSDQASGKTKAKKKGKLTEEGRAKLSSAMKARWAAKARGAASAPAN